MVSRYYKKTKKIFEKKHIKDIKVFLKKQKAEKRLETDIKIFLKKKKKKIVSIIVITI